MATYKPKMTQAEIGLELQKLKERLIDGNGKLFIQITHTSQSNMAYRYKVNLVYYGTNWNGNFEVQTENLSFLLAATWGESMYQGMFNELKGHGIGTDRYFLAAYNIGLTLKQFGLIEDAYQVADRGRKYIEI